MTHTLSAVPGGADGVSISPADAADALGGAATLRVRVERRAAADANQGGADLVAFPVPEGGPPADAAYLLFDARYADAAHGGTLVLRFWARGADGREEGTPRLAGRVTLLPRLHTRVCLPLSLLDGQELFPPRTPGRGKASFQGRRVGRDEWTRVSVALMDSGDDAQTVFLSAALTLAAAPPAEGCPPPDAPLVDELGQWAGRAWPGRVRDAADLRDRLHAARAETDAPSAPGRTRWGGSLEHHFETTGFFHTARDADGRWWLVDPDGGGFFSAGVDVVTPGESEALVPGTEPLHAWLPAPDDPTYAACWSDTRRADYRSFSWARANLVRAFGPDDWRAAWARITERRMRAWGFNTVGNWADADFAERESGLPYVARLSGGMPTTPVKLFRDLPDVFDPAYAAAAESVAAELTRFAGDARLIGYFLTNEPSWAFGAHNLASEMLEANPGTHSRRELARWASERFHGDATAWASAWNLPAETAFADLETRTFRRLDTASERAAADLLEFSRLLVRRWLEPVCAACRRALPTHLNLGVRYAWVSSELCWEGGDLFDVFSINNYGMLPPLPSARDTAARTGRPVLIGEYHFGATDRGLPSSGLRRTTTQEERGVAYRRYVEACAAEPSLVGAHYFQWNDQPLLGRFDGENCQIGFVDVCHTPYTELVAAATETHARLYDVRVGRAAPYDRAPAELPRIF